MTVGPIQLIALTFDRIDQFTGDIRRQLEALRQHGTLRVVDLLFVAKEADGTIHALQGGNLTGSEAQEVGHVIRRMMGLESDQSFTNEPGNLAGMLAVSEHEFGISKMDITEMAAQIPAGKAAALLLIEHTWAMGLRDAIQAAGGRMVGQGFLTSDVLMLVGQELVAAAEAQEAIVHAHIAKGAAMLDAMLTIERAEAVKTAAVEEAAQTVEEAALIQDMAVAHTVQTLVAAGIIEQVATEQAIAALIAADLLTDQVAQAAQTAGANASDTPTA